MDCITTLNFTQPCIFASALLRSIIHYSNYNMVHEIVPSNITKSVYNFLNINVLNCISAIVKKNTVPMIKQILKPQTAKAKWLQRSRLLWRLGLKVTFKTSVNKYICLPNYPFWSSFRKVFKANGLKQLSTITEKYQISLSISQVMMLWRQGAN